MKGTRDGFRGCKTLNKVNPLDFLVKLKEPKFRWGLKMSKTNKEERLTISEDKL